MWAGDDNGLLRYDGRSWNVPGGAGEIPEEYISDIAEAPDGTLWVVADGALYQLEGEQWRRFEWPGGWLDNMAVAPDGTVWAGHEGLGHFDPHTGSWQTFGVADGLVHHVVEAIYVTPDGAVWVGTKGGIGRYIPQQ